MESLEQFKAQTKSSMSAHCDYYVRTAARKRKAHEEGGGNVNARLRNCPPYQG